jgi:hypothetical protein
MAGTQRGVLLVVLVVIAPATAKDYAVGDESGWKSGVDYTVWAKGKAFNVGDSLCKHQILSIAVCLHSRRNQEQRVSCFHHEPGMKINRGFLARSNGSVCDLVRDDRAAFQYGTGHSVEEVTAKDYDACSASKALGSYKDQSTSIPLTKPGTRYFICGAAGHCASGMKLAITVSDPTAPATTTASPTARSTNRPAASGSDATDSDESGAACLVTGFLFGVMGLAAVLMA